MKFLIRELEEGIHEIPVSGRLDPGKYPVAKYFPEEMQLVLNISRFKENVSAEVKVDAIGHLQCDRCLDDYTHHFLEKATLFFEITQPGETSDYEGEEDVIVLQNDEKDYDLSAYIAELLALALPIKKLCKSDCAGLCSTCGVNLNREKCSCRHKKIDPRLEALKKFYK